MRNLRSRFPDLSTYSVPIYLCYTQPIRPPSKSVLANVTPASLFHLSPGPEALRSLTCPYPPMLSAKLLGRFELNLDTQPVALPSRAAQSLAAYLLLHPGDRHRREKLAGVLWPDSPEANARNYLRQALWHLRQALPDTFLHTDRMTIGWQTDAAWRLDVDQLRHPGQDDIKSLAVAVEVYAGELLPGFYEEWVLRERERLAALYDERIARLLELLLAVNEWRQAIDRAEKWIAHGHTPEPAYRALMQAHASLGNTAAALAVYQRCVDALESELGVPPSPETAALAASLRNGEFPDKMTRWQGDRAIHTSPSHPVISSPFHPVIPSNLPAPTTPLIGRENELAALAALLVDPDQRLVTIVGPGGMGKTRLALAAAQDALDSFPDGVFLVDLTALRSAADLPRAVGESIGYPFQNDSRSLRQQIRDYLARRRMLLLLDNFEHLLDGAGFIMELLQAAPGLRLLATSRERLHLQAERLLHLTGLVYPLRGAEPAGEAHSAVALFVQCAQRLRREFKPEREELAAIARICRQVDGMPLAILLAAGWSDLLTPQEIAGEIAQGVGLLQMVLEDLPPRHRNIATVFEQSWQRLSGDEQQSLMALSICVGGFDREAAQAIAGAGLPLLTRLVDKSLLWRVRDGRYTLHELVRQLSGEKLPPANESAARQAHCVYYLTLAATHGARLVGPSYAHILAKLGEEEGNIQAAWRWAAGHKESALLKSAVDSVAGFYHRPGRLQEGADLLSVALREMAEGSNPLEEKVYAYLMAWRGTLRRYAGRIQQGSEDLRRSIELLTGLQERNEETRAERAFALRQANAEFYGSNEEQIIAECAESLRLCRELNDLAGEAESLQILGKVYLLFTNAHKAQAVMEESLRIQRRLQNPIGLFEVLEWLSAAHSYQAHFDEAVAKAEESLATIQEYGIAQPPRTGRLALALMCAGRLREAEEVASRNVRQQLEWGSETEALTWTLNSLARIQSHLGHYAAARQQAEKAGRLFEQLRGWQQPFFMRVRGVTLLAEGAYGEAADALSAVLDSSQRQTTGSRNNPVPYTDLAYALLTTGDVHEARNLLRTALTAVREGADYFLALRAVPACALLLAAQEEMELVVAFYAFAQTYPYIANSRWYYDVAGRKLDALAATLPADVRSAAEERGRKMELPEVTDELLGLL